jgi:predicted transcriptional regulator
MSHAFRARVATATLPEHYCEFVVASLVRGLAQAAVGETLAHDDVIQRMRQRWLRANTPAR